MEERVTGVEESLPDGGVAVSNSPEAGLHEVAEFVLFVPRSALNLSCFSDTANGANEVNDTATLEYMKNTFTAHYNGNRYVLPLVVFNLSSDLALGV